MVQLYADFDALLSLHGEVEAGASEAGTDVKTFLDATGFWDTPLRAGALPTAVKEACAASAGCIVHHAEPARAATDAELRCGQTTSTRYLRQLRQVGQKAKRATAGWVWLDRDKTSVVTAQTEATARRAVGAVLEAVDWVWPSVRAVPRVAAGPRRAVVLQRPPGHHNACDERLEALERQGWRYASGGGCIFNETAVAVRILKKKRPTCRIAVLDLDAHFGDGTAWHFYEDPSVLCVSLHLDQSDLHVFPYLKGKAEERGMGVGAGHTLNLPLPPESGDAEAGRLLREFAMPAIAAHEPELLFLSLGFDGLDGDPTGAELRYTSSLFEQAAYSCREVCPRLVCTLQGGYLPEAMADAVGGVLRVVNGQAPAHPLPEKVGSGFEAHVQALKKALEDKGKWWSLQRSFTYVPDGFEEDDEGAEEEAAVQVSSSGDDAKGAFDIEGRVMFRNVGT